MKLLLDTHVVLWAIASPSRLPPRVHSLLSDPDMTAGVSVISFAELAIKQSLGKLLLPGPVATWLPSALSALSLIEVPLTGADAARVGSLPWYHRDPFDRLLIAQALGGWTLVTADDLVRRYPVPTLWD